MQHAEAPAPVPPQVTDVSPATAAPRAPRTRSGVRRDALAAATAALRRAEVSEVSAARGETTKEGEANAVNATLRMLARDFHTECRGGAAEASPPASARVRWGPRARALRRECHLSL